MTDPIAVLLKFGFLAVLYLFLLWVVRSAMRDMAGHGRLPDEDEEPAEARGDRGAGLDLRSGVRPRLDVVAALGHEPGTSFEISGSATLGRSPTADVRIDDPFASAAHARIFPRGQFMWIEDMGSTNGTYLNGRQLRKPEQLRVADTVRIGDTEYRYQE
ncbi:MAG TPA: FHA domain-containing protein [Thermoleophilaceae bacterium]